jgi:hypothetical protein
LAPRLWSNLDLPRPAEVRFSVGEPLTASPRQKPGDIDVLVCATHLPDQAVAFECKRVKIKPETFDTMQVGKLPGLTESVHQVRGLIEIGFSRCFLLVFIAVDGRERVQFNFAGRGPTAPLIRCIDDAIHASKIHEEAGVVVIELVQPTTEDFENAGGVGIRVLRSPCYRTQPPDLTRRVTVCISSNTL